MAPCDACMRHAGHQPAARSGVRCPPPLRCMPPLCPHRVLSPRILCARVLSRRAQVKCATGSVNQIPPWVEIRGDVRLTPFYEIVDMRAMFAEYLTDLNANLERRRPPLPNTQPAPNPNPNPQPAVMVSSSSRGAKDSWTRRCRRPKYGIARACRRPKYGVARPTRYVRATADLSATECDDRVADFLVSSESLVARWSGTARYGPQDQCSPQRGCRA